MVRFGSVTQIINGDRSSNYPSGDDFQNAGVPFINAGHLLNGKVDYSSMDYISREKYNQLSGAKIRQNDILLCLRGSLGKYALVTIDGGAPASSIAVIRPNTEIIDPHYLLQIIASSVFQKQIEVENNGSSQPNLSAKSVSEFTIPLPSLEEQRNIASALCDVDMMIFTLDKQIAKKRAIKQGAMQELLTGKKRLPGFENEWEEICLADVCTFYGGGTPDKKKTNWWNGNIPWISSSDLQENDITNINIDRFITHEALEKSATQLCPLNSVLVVTRVGVGKVAVTPCSICTSQDFTSIVSRVHNSYFLAYVLQPIMKRLAEQSQGTSIKGVTSDDIKQIVIRTPNKEEQKAIAETLFYMDEEIRLLEKKLGKCRQIKQGMMQQLLTGKIRI